MASAEHILYRQRPGTYDQTIHLDVDIKRESPLGEARDDVLAFEQQLFMASLDRAIFPETEKYRLKKEAQGHTVYPIETIWDKKIHATAVGISYFMTSEGKTALSESVGIKLSDTDTEDDCVRLLSNADLHGVGSDVLDKLEADSVGYEEDMITQAFIANGYNGKHIPAPQIMTLYKNPETLVEKVDGYRTLKGYIKQVLIDLQRNDPEATLPTRAKVLLATLYIQKINMLLSGTDITAYKLLSQHHKGNKETLSTYITQLDELIPAFSPHAQNERIANFLQRIDRFTEGASRNDQGKFTWLSPEAANLAKQADSNAPNTHGVNRGPYTSIDPEKLEASQITGETFGEWVTIVLKSYGILSIHTAWDSERTGPASDNKWQVIVDNKFKSLAVNDKQRIVKIPATSRSIFKAVTLANHEVTHVLQAENKRALGQLAIMQRIGIDSVSEQAEAGGEWQERIASEALLGRSEHEISGTSYLKALEVKAQGGTFGECLQAYFEDLSLRMPRMAPQKVAAQAVNRTRRIFRGGGFEFAQNTTYLTNTQPLNYLEQQLIYENLGPEQRKLLFVGGIAIKNLVKLAEVGLVDVTQIHIPDKMPWELLHEYVERQLAEIV